MGRVPNLPKYPRFSVCNIFFPNTGESGSFYLGILDILGILGNMGKMGIYIRGDTHLFDTMY